MTKQRADCQLRKRKVIVETKSIHKLSDIDKKQLLTYLRLIDNKLGCC